MRKYIQKNLLNSIDTMKNANSTLINLIENLHAEQMLELLTDIQELAIQMGNEIEKSQGQDTKVVHLLEQYCELIYNCYQADNNNIQIIIIAQMNDMVEKINTKILEIPVKYEIVFMPYNASMWDCLESVWMAAEADENCDCYVVPIPYYDRDEDGTLGGMRYEGSQFPANVPITDYNKYDFSDRHPEVIYIHNPFDNFNKVTTIHPDYYSSKIREFTEMLVYIPYYITGYHLPDAHKLLPAYIYADKTILQNDSMIADIDEMVPKEKLLALGSPKSDKVLRLCDNPPEIPEEWKQIIVRKDNTKNKVIMYNISITGLLNLKLNLLMKMEYVFNVIKKSEGVVLLWRPHPLLESTLKSMEPELVHEYNRLKDMFISEKIGIYDGTPDPDLSVALSDAYIGESSSSLVYMFGLAGKPIIILDDDTKVESENITDAEMRLLSFGDMAVDGDEAWFVSNRYQVICKMNLNSGKVDMVARIPETEMKLMNLYSYIYIRNRKLYLTPLHTDALCIYDLENNTFQKIYFPDSKINNFMDMSFKGDEIILKPSGYDGIVRYNKKNGKWVCINGFIEEYEKRCESYNATLPRFIGRWKEYDNKLYMPCFQFNGVLVFNLLDNTWRYYEVGSKGNTYRDIEKVGNEFWLLPYLSDSFVKWNIDSGIYTEYDSYLQKCNLEKNCKVDRFGWWGKLGENLMAIPILADNIVQVDTKQDKINIMEVDENLDVSNGKFKVRKSYSNYDFVLPYRNKILLKSTFNESLLLATADHEKLVIENRWQARLSKEDMQKIRNIMNNDEQILRSELFGYIENSEISSLKILVEDVVLSKNDKCEEQRKFYSRMIKNMDGSVGQKIHDYIMDESASYIRI